MTSSTAWPEGVIARYLTIAGTALPDPTITVDVTQGHRYIDSDELRDGLATCTGCGTRKRFADIEAERWDGTEHALERNTDAARHWAQSHAETCRALPKPTN